MHSSAILEYLVRVSRTKYQAQSAFFENRTTLDSPQLPLAGPLVQNLKIHHLLRGIEKHVAAIEKHERLDPDRSVDDLKQAAAFFEPLVLHHWQLERLLNVLRCHTDIFKLAAKKRECRSNLEKLQKEIRNTRSTFLVSKLRQDIEEQKLSINLANAEYERAHTAMQNDEKTQANIQEALVLATLLNVIFRKGMSAPMLSDNLNLEAQQKEYRDLLRDCGIVFDVEEDAAMQASRVESFPAIFTQHPSLLSKEIIPRDPLSKAKYIISLVLRAQSFHTQNNHWRLGGTRLRREFIFLNNYMQNSTFSAAINAVDPYVRRGLSYVNWMFFIPRLTLNFSLLYHHLFNEKELNPLERAFPYGTRFRAHWTRFWFELIMDSYWILNGLTICFVLNGGVFSGPGLYLTLTVQTLDLLCSIIRAGIELYRLYCMKCDLLDLDPKLDIKNDMEKRFQFEAYALGYSVFHFSVLMLSLCLTLPGMASVSMMWPIVAGVGAMLMAGAIYYTENNSNRLLMFGICLAITSMLTVSALWPVVGGACAVMITIATYYKSRYLNKDRENLYQPKPEALNVLGRQYSHVAV